MTETTPPTVSYWAISILNSRTAWVAAGTILTGVLALPEVVAVIPLRWLPIILALVGSVQLVLRVVTVRPVAFIAPGTTVPVAVAKIDPPTPPVITD